MDERSNDSTSLHHRAKAPAAAAAAAPSQHGRCCTETSRFKFPCDLEFSTTAVYFRAVRTPEKAGLRTMLTTFLILLAFPARTQAFRSESFGSSICRHTLYRRRPGVSHSVSPEETRNPRRVPRRQPVTSSKATSSGEKQQSNSKNNPPPPPPPKPKHRPIPVMPSPLFQELALSQLEFLASALGSPQRPGSSKVKSMALYLPQENIASGQLEFTPAVLYPNKDRVFIAPEAASGVAPTLPRSLTKLPGFSHAKSLIPGYPMVSSGRSSIADGGGTSSITDGSVGMVEEVLCSLESPGACALSVPLFSGRQTVGVLLVSPADVPEKPNVSVWTQLDRQQVARAARSLSLALSMDQENQAAAVQNEQIAQALSDSMHQVKNPLQALRTYGKILQRHIANEQKIDEESPYFQKSSSSQSRLLELADHLMVQSDRLTQRLAPVDVMVEKLSLSNKRPSLLLPAPAAADAKSTQSTLAPSSSLAQWSTPLVPWDEFVNTTVPRASRAARSKTNRESKVTNGEDSLRVALQQLEKKKDKIIEASQKQPTPDSITKKLESEMAFVPDVLEPVFSAFSAIAEDSGISFQVHDESDELPGVHIHPESLQEVVSNILDNAFKYGVLGSNGTPNASPQVRVCLLPNQLAHEEEKGAGVTIIVTDNGPGIPKEDLKDRLIFRRGYRVSATQDEAQGKGLGLSIAENLVTAMGGKLQFVAVDKKWRSMLRKECSFDVLDGATIEVVLYRNPRPML